MAGGLRGPNRQSPLFSFLFFAFYFSKYLDPKRRSELLTYCDTMDEFVKLVKERGFDVEKTTLYHRLIPRRKNSIAGQRHINTIKVRLAKPQEDDHGNHPSKRFCLAESRMNKQLASLLG